MLYRCLAQLSFCVLFVAGCQSSTEARAGGDAMAVGDPMTVGDSYLGSDDVPGDGNDVGVAMGTFALTYYWVASEDDYSGSADTVLSTCTGESLATVASAFASALRLEGTGKLHDGRMLNIGDCSCNGTYACFVELDANFPWGMGSAGNALVPFVSVAVDHDVFAHGTLLYSPDLDGVALPGGELHDGCLRADDTGSAIVGAHLDWFVALRDHYLDIDPLVPESVSLHRDAARCAYLGD